MELCGIYSIQNVLNGRKYIGMSMDIHRRWEEHITELNRGKHNNQYLQYSWNKYGEEYFRFSIIDFCDEDSLSEKEKYYIKLYKTLAHENGYNLTIGGENTSIGKLVISLKDGKIYNFVSEAAKIANVSHATMTRWCKQKHNYMYLDEFNKMSQEEKTYWIYFDWNKFDHEKLSKAHSRENLSKETISKLKIATFGKNNPRAYKVYCPQLNEIFDCAKDATVKYGINRGSISQCIKGKLKSAGRHPITGERLTWEKV